MRFLLRYAFSLWNFFELRNKDNNFQKLQNNGECIPIWFLLFSSGLQRNCKKKTIILQNADLFRTVLRVLTKSSFAYNMFCNYEKCRYSCIISRSIDPIAIRNPEQSDGGTQILIFKLPKQNWKVLLYLLWKCIFWWEKEAVMLIIFWHCTQIMSSLIWTFSTPSLPCHAVCMRPFNNFVWLVTLCLTSPFLGAWHNLCMTPFDKKVG